MKNYLQLRTYLLLLLSAIGMTACSDDEESANVRQARENRAALTGYWQIEQVLFDEILLPVDDRTFYFYAENNRFFVVRNVPPGTAVADHEHILSGSWRIDEASPTSLAIFDLNEDIRDFSAITELTDSTLVLTTREITNTNREVDRITSFKKDQN